MVNKSINTESDKEKEINKKSEKQINPFKDKGNYVIQVINEGEILKQVIALNSTVNIIYLGEQAVAAEIK